MLGAFLVSPILAAVVFTITQSYHMMHRPDTIYIPVIFEILFFGLGYVAYGVVNAIIIVPLSIGLTSFTQSRLVGFISAIAIAVFTTYLAYNFGFFGNKPTIMHEAYILGIFFPILLSAMVSFFFIAKHRAKKHSKSNADN